MDSWDNPVYDAMQAYQKTAALTAAVKLDIVTLIGGGAATSDALAEKTAASSRGMRILCDFLTVMGLLSKQDGAYSATEPAQEISRSLLTGVDRRLDRILRRPRNGAPRARRPGFLRETRRFGRACAPGSRPSDLAPLRQGRDSDCTRRSQARRRLSRCSGPRPLTVLDVAAGHGFYGIELAKAFPEAVVTAVDWPSVLELASANARDAGVGERFRVVAGNAFEVDWGDDFDLVILANFLHYFSPEECATILRKVKSSLSPRGRACAVDFVPDEDRVSPPMQAMFAFLMLATTPGGDA